MLFNSFLFLFFFAAAYVIYWVLRGKARLAFLIGASILFYSAWGLQREGLGGLRWTFHFLIVTFINYVLIHAMFRFPERKKALIRIIVTLDILNLAVFKYFAFFREVLHDFSFHLPQRFDALNLFLPLAISFYTFQLIAYAMDVYRGTINERVPLGRFYLFFLFFPHFIAGPIMRATDLMPQIDRPFVDRSRMLSACWLILGGLVKKVLLADPMGGIVAPVFQEPQAFDAWSILLAGACFSLQVYCDFSGYTDIARGCAYLLGFDIPENFTAPFFAKSARELWQRWHITLATWLRDYLYIPLGGSRKSEVRTHLNLIITFTLGGFWHGADWSYILWGFFWGALLSLERFLENNLGFKTVPQNRILAGGKILFMFFLFSLGALMFRTQPVVFADRSYSTLHMLTEVFSGAFSNGHLEALTDFKAAGGDAGQIFAIFGSQIFDARHIGPPDTILWMFIGLCFFHWVQYAPERFDKFKEHSGKLLLATSAIVGGLLIPSLVSGTSQFIYFVF
ncbi:MAG: MBOAT family protein [Spirochaetia bacterium]|nr:MBOAT family protein [Spirochaetia bacterium]